MDKKFVMGIAAMAALTLVSCSSDDLDSFSDNSSKNEAISFDGYLGRSAVAVNGTRGSVLDKTTLQSAGFGVFGNYSATESENANFGTNLFNNVKVTGTTSTGGTEWTYGGVKYWPLQGQIDFLAYAPHETGKTLKNTSCIDFTVKPTATDQKDLLWANATKQTTTTIAGNGNKVKFQFKHALSRLGFTVKLKKEPSTDATIMLTNIKLAGSTDGTSKSAFYTGGDFDLAKGEWSQAALNTTTKQNLDLFSGSKKVTSTSQSNIDFGKDYLFVIPQEFPSTTEDNKLYVIVEYTMQYTDVKGSDGQPAIITNKVYKQLTNNKKFEQGKAYMINLTIGRPIEFDADVTDWTTDGTNPNTDINIDSWE